MKYILIKSNSAFKLYMHTSGSIQSYILQTNDCSTMEIIADIKTVVNRLEEKDISEKDIADTKRKASLHMNKKEFIVIDMDERVNKSANDKRLTYIFMKKNKTKK